MGKIASNAKPHDDPAVQLAATIGYPFPEIELFDHIADTVFFIKDREARYVAVNHTLVRRCGFRDKRSLIGRKTSEVFPPPLGEQYRAQDLSVIANGLSIRSRMELHLYPDGSEGWCFTWKAPIVDASGAVHGLVGISRDAPALARPDSESEGLSSTLAYIDDHLDSALRVPELARRAGLSTFQFDQRIRALFGVSAGQYLSRLRIDRACDRLRHANSPLSQLAAECGYADQAAFTRQFHKTIGLTPGAYRLTAARRRERRSVQ